MIQSILFIEFLIIKVCNKTSEKYKMTKGYLEILFYFKWELFSLILGNEILSISSQ